MLMSPRAVTHGATSMGLLSNHDMQVLVSKVYCTITLLLHYYLCVLLNNVGKRIDITQN